MSNVVINVSPKPISVATASAGKNQKRSCPFYLFSYCCSQPTRRSPLQKVGALP